MQLFSIQINMCSYLMTAVHVDSKEFLEVEEFQSMTLPERMFDEASLLGLQDIRGRPVCPVCGKSFFDRSNRNRHLKMHFSGRKSFTCKICQKTFTWKNNLTTHMKHYHVNNY
ncbi:zinc finger protein 2-like [Limulus polyphemus]|uniref:Zinc finger protein 2-like n=1 Tax=Limulus polyphemus TaxID=6850 RepID=A0ABM1T0F0_LIMPO|nr:zinc finger protein 2-like [Limulus polyphemus]